MDAMTQKKIVGQKAADMTKDGQIIGLGTGSTVTWYAKALKERIENGDEFYAVPTSFQSLELCVQNGIKTTTLQEHMPEIAFDGADEVDANNCLIKGRGGALTQEKIIDYYAKEFYVLVDQSKMVDILGTSFKTPVEVIPMGLAPAQKELAKFGTPHLRQAQAKDGPVVTDNGNFIVDVEMKIDDPASYEASINNIPGVIENGIFTRDCKIIIPNNDVIDII